MTTLFRALALSTLAAAALAACKPAPQEQAPAAPVADAAVDAPAAAADVPAADAAAPSDAAAASELAFLQEHAGKYPHDASVNYLEQGPLAERLKTLLGERYAKLLDNLQTSGPLTADGDRFFITGNAKGEGSSEEAAIVVDLPQNAVRVWLHSAGQMQEFIDPAAATVEWPEEVATTIKNATEQPK